MKTLIAANWKMNPASQKEAKSLFDKVKKSKRKFKNSEVVICPPFAWLAVVSHMRNEGGLLLGAQNVFFEEKGAFTGEVSCLMLKDLKVDYVILGHSERRKYFGETDEMINKKIKKSLSVKLKPIFCIGETKDEKDQNKKSEVLERQITDGLKSVTKDEMKNVAVAYEPVWAIGTGNNCSVDETMGSVLFIRKILTKLYNREVADSTRILYGGSVKSENSGDYIKKSGADGLLVGGASLNPEEFVKIIKSAE
jgi:triosephosphate isomerase